MPEISRADQLRDSKNPLFTSKRKLKLGTFCSNLSGGCAITKIDGTLKAEWPQTLALAQMGDEMNFEALVPVGRWKGFGGETNFNGEGFECYTWAAGVSASTKNAGIFATSHVPTVHPVMAAKQATTIDHISGGRFTLNLVTGWYQPEIEMFGEPMMEHDERYVRAKEWLDVIKLLWTRGEEFDYEGHYYHIKKGWLAPKPIQQPHPVVMCAGGSPKGKEFAAQNCDVSFVAVTSHDPAEIKASIDAYRAMAREHGREIQIWTNAYIVQGETEADAKAFYNHYVNEQGDWTAAENLVATLGIKSESFPPGVARALKEHFIAGWGGFPLVGTKEQVIDGLQLVHNCGFDGVILSWARYVDEMREFQRETYPLMVQAGLR